MMSDRRLRIIIYTVIPLLYYTKSFPRFLSVFVFVYIVFFLVVVVVVALSFPRIAVKSLANDDETTVELQTASYHTHIILPIVVIARGVHNIRLHNIITMRLTHYNIIYIHTSYAHVPTGRRS